MRHKAIKEKEKERWNISWVNDNIIHELHLGSRREKMHIY